MKIAPCVHVQLAARKIQKNPVETARRVVRGATLTFVPNTINDVVFHHTNLDVNEVFHSTQDVLVNTTLALAITLSKLV